jgi:hypothetical protein
MQAKDVTVRGTIEFFGGLGLIFFVCGLGAQDKEDAPATIARLDDELSPMPRILLAYEATSPNPYENMAGLGRLGDTAEPAEPAVGTLTVTDEASAPLKLRRMEVVRAGSEEGSNALRAVTQNTSQRAKRANRAIPSLVNAVVARYGTLISQAAALHNVPAQLIACKICIENPDMLASVVTGGGATGIMQIAPGTADAALRDEYKANNLLPQEVAYFQRKLGSRWASLLAGHKAHTTGDLQNPAYCIHVGTLCFGQYLRKYTNPATGQVYVHKAAAEYNRGPRAAYANLRTNTPDELIGFKGPGKTSTPPTTQQYVMMYCGPGGPLDYLTSKGLLA